MSDSNRNTILAILLIGLILVLTPSYLRFINPPAEDKLPNPAEADSPYSYDPPPVTIPSPATTGGTGTNLIPAISSPTNANLGEQVDESFISIETLLYSAQFSSLGGGKITNWVLNDFLDHNSNPVKMVHSLNTGNLGIRFIDVNRDTIDLSSFNWLSAPENQIPISTEDKDAYASNLIKEPLSSLILPLILVANKSMISAEIGI